MKILDFDLEGSHFIIEADISPRQEADDDMECQWLRYDFDNTQVIRKRTVLFRRSKLQPLPGLAIN